MSAAFGFPATSDSRGVYLAEKTHRLPDGRFEACAAIFAWGQRGLTVYAVSASRSRAALNARLATDTQSAYRHMLADGRVSLSPQDGSAQ